MSDPPLALPASAVSPPGLFALSVLTPEELNSAFGAELQAAPVSRQPVKAVAVKARKIAGFCTIYYLHCPTPNPASNEIGGKSAIFTRVHPRKCRFYQR